MMRFYRSSIASNPIIPGSMHILIGDERISENPKLNNVFKGLA